MTKMIFISLNPVEDLGFMHTRDPADPDGHLWAAWRTTALCR